MNDGIYLHGALLRCKNKADFARSITATTNLDADRLSLDTYVRIMTAADNNDVESLNDELDNIMTHTY